MLISVTSQEIKFVRVYTIVHPIVLCILMGYKLNDPEIKPCPSKHRRKNTGLKEKFTISLLVIRLSMSGTLNIFTSIW